MTTDMQKAPSVARKALTSTDDATPVARYDLSTSEGGRRYIADFFATELRRHDFAGYINTHLAADFACALAQHLAATGKQQVGEVQGDERRQWLEIRGLAAGIVKNLKAFAESPHKASWCGALDDSLSFADQIEKDADAAYTAALAARQPGAQKPVVVEAVATIKLDSDGEFYVDWLTEGGIHDLSVGDVLLAANSAITNDEGYGEVYAAPPAQGIDLGQLWEPIKEAVHTALSVHMMGISQKKRESVAVYVARLLRDGQRDAAPGVAS